MEKISTYIERLGTTHMHSTEFTFRPRIRLLQISQMPGFMACVYLKMGIFAFTFSNVKEIVIFVFCA